MGQLGRVVKGVDVRMSAIYLRRGDVQTSKSEEQSKQDEPSSHGDLCLSAARIRPLRGKA
jgi:hypothetical protein